MAYEGTYYPLRNGTVIKPVDCMSMTQTVQLRSNKPIKEEIEKAIKMLNDMSRDVTVDKVVQIASINSILKNVIDRLEMMSIYMSYLIDKILKENNVEIIHRLVEKMRKPIWDLAMPDHELLALVDKLWETRKEGS